MLQPRPNTNAGDGQNPAARARQAKDQAHDHAKKTRQ